MKAMNAAAVIALSGLTACQHFETPGKLAGAQAIQVDQQTMLIMRMEGAAARPSAPETAGIPLQKEGEPIHRILRSGDGQVLFAYDLEVAKSSPDGSYRFLLKPASQKPTFASSREVTVKPHDTAVRIELMEQPATGQKIEDVFRLANRNEIGSEDQPPGFISHLKAFHDMFWRHIHGK